METPNIEEIFARVGLNLKPRQMLDFLEYTITMDNWKNFWKSNHDDAEQKLRQLKINLKNGQVGKQYNEVVDINCPLSEDVNICLDAKGLECKRDGDKLYICGTPEEAGSYELRFQSTYKGWAEGEPMAEAGFKFNIIPDPRSLWKNDPTPTDIDYYKPDSDSASVVSEDFEAKGLKRILAASMRGRSHANEAIPRDDDFAIEYCPETGWYIIVVADGAGSAKYSREGSRIACCEVMDACKSMLANAQDLEDGIALYQENNNEEDEKAGRKLMGDELYKLFGKSSFAALKAIDQEAKNKGAQLKDYSTTLIIAVCKKFDFGWFTGSYWIGDGAACIFTKGTDEEPNNAKMLGEPDEGEFSGQTRFLTMPNISTDPKEIFSRIKFDIRKDFTALLLMTDGVSDALMETDNNLKNPDKWADLWELLCNGFPDDKIEGIDFSNASEEEKQEKLKQWLMFWKAGNHDDRTIAILY